MNLPDSLIGDRWTETTARRLLPFLVALAEQGKTTTYSDLSLEAQKRGWSHYVIPLKFKNPAGCIGRALETTSDVWGSPIPPLNTIIVAKKDKLPGKGADPFIERFLKRSGASMADASDRASIIEEIHKDVFNFPHWQDLLEEYGLEPTQVGSQPTSTLPPSAGGWPQGGEGPEHLELKLLVARSPGVLGLGPDLAPGDTEFLLPSGDSVDVMFQAHGWAYAIEVKPSTANISDLERGVYQCIKYREVIRAYQRANGLVPHAHAILALADHPPQSVIDLAEALSVSWVVIES